MATITLKGNTIHTSGELPAIGSAAPDFKLVSTGLAVRSLADFPGVRVLNIFPSVDTAVCAMSVRAFNEQAAGRPGVHVLNISADLPFAHARFCGAEGIERAVSLSTFRGGFAEAYSCAITDGPLAGLCSRAVVIVNADGKVIYTEQVPEITQEPNYAAALAAL